MENNKVCRITEVKENGSWNIFNIDYDERDVYCELSNRLISKKINKCTWIKSVKRTPLYNGYQKIVIYYYNGVKDTFIIED